MNLLKNRKFIASKAINVILMQFIIASQLLFHNVHSFENQDIMRLTYKCFYSKKSYVCKDALKQIELLQLFVAAKKNYSCQTRLLGLEAKLIMVLLEMPRGRSYIENVNDVKRACKAFLKSSGNNQDYKRL